MIFSYEKSGTHQFEIPRMFTENPKILESYVRRKRDPYVTITVLLPTDSVPETLVNYKNGGHATWKA